MGIGRAMTGGGDGVGRQENDFYPTPADVTTALLAAWRPRASRVWEPACGDGAMSRVLQAAGMEVLSTDLHNYGFGEANVDFLTMPAPAHISAMITNPPFKLMRAFIEHAYAIGLTEIAMLGKSTYWHAAGRIGTFMSFRPTYVMPLTWRPDFLGMKRPTMEACWFVWDRLQPLQGVTYYVPLIRPERPARPRSKKSAPLP